MIDVSASQEEADICGSVEELREVGLTIRALIASAIESVAVPASGRNPAPYDCALAELKVALQPGLALVSIQGHALCVSGSTERLEELASCFFFPDDAGAGHHFHFEPLPEDSDYSADSLALAVSVRHSGA